MTCGLVEFGGRCEARAITVALCKSHTTRRWVGLCDEHLNKMRAELAVADEMTVEAWKWTEYPKEGQ